MQQPGMSIALCVMLLATGSANAVLMRMAEFPAKVLFQFERSGKLWRGSAIRQRIEFGGMRKTIAIGGLS